MKNLLLFLGICVGLVIVISKAKAQNTSMFIYGEVTTISGDVYEGPIRWGSDEVYWEDMLNATKTSNDFTRHLSKSELEDLKKSQTSSSWFGLDINVFNIWEDRYRSTAHQFDTQFGNIKSIEPSRRNRTKITMKNGVAFEVDGSTSSDLSTGITINIMDQELGMIKLKWSRIEKIDFKSTPDNLEEVFGDPIYGRIHAGRRGVFEGLVIWDYSGASSDEKFLSDVLDGKTRNRDQSIPFRSISSIERNRNGVDVTLHSGREFYLTGSNDVDQSNNGIAVNVPGIGRVEIGWRDFTKLEVLKTPTATLTYDDFPSSTGLTGTVRTLRGEEYKGLIAFDLDEAWQYETLDGSDGATTFEIPFRNVARIIPKNSSFASIELTNGDEFLLGDANDLTDDNKGILIFTANDERPVYIRWSRVDEIIFN